MENQEFKNKTFKCPLCDEKIPIKSDRKNKPYIICNSCGLQMFIRYPSGIQILIEKIGSSWF